MNIVKTKRDWLERWLPWTIGLLAFFIFVVSLASSVFAGGPANRPTFTSAEPADYVVFNAITDNPEHGDERNFVLIREAGTGTYVNEMKLEPGKEYEVYSYFHNNAKSSLNTGEGTGIARNTRMSADVPTVLKPGERGRITSTISADNANPQRVWDEAYITADSTVHLRFVPASAKVHSGGAVNGATLSDSLFSSAGTFLGYSQLNGILPGCADYAGYVVYRIKVDQPNFDMSKEVSPSGQGQWAKQVNSKAGDKVDFRITYKNTGTTDQNNVTVKDTLPKGLTYIPGSTVVTNNSNPNGLRVSDNLTTEGINIGNYGPGASATITFSASVNKSSEEEVCGSNNFVNKASVTTGGGTREDTATVVIPGEDCVPAELPTTGPAEIIAGILGVALVSLGIAYWIRSRNSYKRALAGFTEDVMELPEERLLTSRTETHPEDDKKSLF